MWPRNFVGEGTVALSGTEATQGERKRGSVVAAAMAYVDPGSGVSGDCAEASDASISSRLAHRPSMRISPVLRYILHPLLGEPDSIAVGRVLGG